MNYKIHKEIKLPDSSKTNDIDTRFYKITDYFKQASLQITLIIYLIMRNTNFKGRSPGFQACEMSTRYSLLPLPFQLTCCRCSLAKGEGVMRQLVAVSAAT